MRQVWGRAAELDRIDRDASGREAIAARDWYINGQGQTFSIIRGPVEFLIGSPRDEPGRYKDENQHRVRIERTFAMATREVTLEQYVRFLKASPEVYPNRQAGECPPGLADARLPGGRGRLVRCRPILQLVEPAGRDPSIPVVLPAGDQGRGVHTRGLP